MIGKKMQDAMNEQIKQELGSSYLYLSMAAYFQSSGLDGMARWMRAQTQEELVHAMKLFDHIEDRGGKVKLLALTQPTTEWASPLTAFQAAWKHEQFISSRIDNLVELAAEEKDHPAGILLQWFVTEQVEEEASVSKVVQLLERVGDSGNGLIMLDRELGARVFTPPTTADAAAQ
ncbi:MAG: ferritin [Candidatus Latescibacterota bacterium]|nr:MAG: ferritin [Candidatus Latescibacteria bacterium 4484_107]RKY66168.1 MAG: ferritin [Candidatus Latescibacterota bacterium]